MRILMTTDAVGGIWTYGLDLAGGLAQSGAEVTLAVLGPALDGTRRSQAEAAGIAIVPIGHPPEWLAESTDAVRATAQEVGNLARAIGGDLVHLNHPALAGLAGFPGHVVGVAHSCVATWWDAVRGSDLPEDFTWRTALVGDGYRAVHRLIAPSRAFAEMTARRYGLASMPSVVYNGRTASTRTPPSVAPPENAVFTAGRLWDDGKAISVLDEAAARLDVPVRAAGPTRSPGGGSISLSRIEVLGSLSETAMQQHLQARPIYASPALYEPFGLAVVEAAQAGCALVLSDIPTFRELWSDAALLVPPNDADALAAAIRTLLSDPERRAALGRTAASRAATYSVDAMVAGTLAAYRASGVDPFPDVPRRV